MVGGDESLPYQKNTPKLTSKIFSMLQKFSILLPFLIFICNSHSLAQVEVPGFGGIINIDSITVTASKQGFDVEDFVEMVRTDKSFYQAFENLRHHTYIFHNQIDIFDKKGKVIGHYESDARQDSDGDCRTMTEWNRTVTGRFFKRKQKHRYYTSKLYDRLFFTKDTVCESTRVYEGDGDPQQEGHINKLKQLVFSPGEKVDVPFIGKKMAIFDEKLAKYYDFHIKSIVFQDSLNAYLFSAKIKPEFLTKKQDKTVIKSLDTYFEKENFQVLARNYQLQYNGALFDFDVTMHIDLQKINDQYLPKLVTYDGNWKVAFKRRERIAFQMEIAR